MAATVRVLMAGAETMAAEANRREEGEGLSSLVSSKQLYLLASLCHLFCSAGSEDNDGKEGAGGGGGGGGVAVAVGVGGGGRGYSCEIGSGDTCTQAVALAARVLCWQQWRHLL
jgi:hypothetical protein